MTNIATQGPRRKTDFEAERFEGLSKLEDTSLRRTAPNRPSPFEPPGHSHDVAAAAKAFAANAVTCGRGDMSSHALATTTFPDARAAQSAFDKQKALLADVHRWNALSGRENASFALVGPDGKPVQRSADVGDFIKVNLPGSPTSDWVRIETIEDTPDQFAITVRPSYDPTARPVDKNVTAHFFTRDATNTFSVEKQGNDVRARVFGLHESANVGPSAGGLLNATRNRAASELAWGIQRPIPGTSLSVNGLQQHQWNVFTTRLNEAR